MTTSLLALLTYVSGVAAMIFAIHFDSVPQAILGAFFAGTGWATIQMRSDS